MSTHRRSQSSGFTLVELLVVIGIIAILITILIPVLNKARDQAKSISCASNERQILMAFSMYVADNKGATPVFPVIGKYYPPVWSAATPFDRSLAYYMDTPDAGASQIRYDVGQFWHYLATGLGINRNTTTTMAAQHQLFGVFNCPADFDYRPDRWGSYSAARALDRNFTYSWNASLYNDPPAPIGGGGEVRWNGAVPAIRKFTQIHESAHKIILEEEASPNDGLSFAGFPAPPGDEDDTPGHVHSGRGNQGFADGHVESFYPSDLGYNNGRKPEDIQDIQPNIQARCGWYYNLRSNSFP